VEDQGIPELDYEFLLLESLVQLLLCQLLYVDRLVLLLLFFSFIDFLHHLLMDRYQSFVHCVLTEELILIVTTAHQEPLEDQVEPLITSELMKAGP